MFRSKKPFLHLLIAVAVLACSDEPGAGPTAPAAVLTPAAAPQPISTDGRYIVLYNRAILDAGRIASIMADHGGGIGDAAAGVPATAWTDGRLSHGLSARGVRGRHAR